jgi:A/G-specific adenine glycosylase
MPKLVRDLKSFYKTQGRAHLPWRKTRDPYLILVSEVMLQQTQVDRVMPFYERFIQKYPTPQALAKAKLGEVLKLWQGLGYNRRAKYLHEAAKILAKEGWTGQKLPGVGPYTRAAVEAFAYDKPGVFIETNIRTVFIHYLFRRKDALVGDAELMPRIEAALAKSGMRPRDFYAALMDYGSFLKRQGIRLNSRSKHYAKQPDFRGSYRQLRGAIVRAVVGKPKTMEELTDLAARRRSEVASAVAALAKEGILSVKNKKISIA